MCASLCECICECVGNDKYRVEDEQRNCQSFFSCDWPSLPSLTHRLPVVHLDTTPLVSPHQFHPPTTPTLDTPNTHDTQAKMTITRLQQIQNFLLQDPTASPPHEPLDSMFLLKVGLSLAMGYNSLCLEETLPRG